MGHFTVVLLLWNTTRALITIISLSQIQTGHLTLRLRVASQSSSFLSIIAYKSNHSFYLPINNESTTQVWNQSPEYIPQPQTFSCSKVNYRPEGLAYKCIIKLSLSHLLLIPEITSASCTFINKEEKTNPNISQHIRLKFNSPQSSTQMCGKEAKIWEEIHTNLQIIFT